MQKFTICLKHMTDSIAFQNCNFSAELFVRSVSLLAVPLWLITKQKKKMLLFSCSGGFTSQLTSFSSYYLIADIAVVDTVSNLIEYISWWNLKYVFSTNSKYLLISFIKGWGSCFPWSRKIYGVMALHFNNKL